MDALLFPRLHAGQAGARVRPGLSDIAFERPGVLVGPLGNNVGTATPPSLEAVRELRKKAEDGKAAKARYESRTLRYQLRRTSGTLSKRANVTKCGRCRYMDGAVGVAVKDGRAHFTGLVHCGSAWECPVCMYTITAGRADEVRSLVGRHRATGGGVYMLTLTLPHDAGDELKPLRRHVTEAWSKVQAGAPYKRARARIGMVGTIRALEVTHGPHGWHPHLHILVLTAAPLEDRATGELGEAGRAYVDLVYRRWVDHVTRRNKITGAIYRAPTREHGLSFLPAHKDEYVAKMGLADELARGSWKKSAALSGYRTPLQILRDISVAHHAGEPARRDTALWVEYADNMHGARQLTWSRGLRQLYDLPDEQTDMELLAAEDEGAEEVFTIPAAVWDRYLKWHVDAQLRVLAAAELYGLPGVIRVVDALEGRSRVPF